MKVKENLKNYFGFITKQSLFFMQELSTFTPKKNQGAWIYTCIKKRISNDQVN